VLNIYKKNHKFTTSLILKKLNAMLVHIFYQKHDFGLPISKSWFLVLKSTNFQFWSKPKFLAWKLVILLSKKWKVIIFGFKSENWGRILPIWMQSLLLLGLKICVVLKIATMFEIRG